MLRRRGRVRGRARLMLRELHLADWRATKDTLHLYCQLLGKIRLATTAPRNHWWNVPLYVDVRGLTTRRLHHADTTFDISLDFVDHALVVRTADGRRRGLRVARRPRRRRVRPAPARCPRRARHRRRDPRDAVRRADDDAVPGRPRARRLGSRVRRALLGGAGLDRPRARGVQRLVQGQDEPGPSVLARPRPGRHALLRTRRPAGRGRPGHAGGLLERGDLVRVLGGRRQPRRRRLLLLHGAGAGWPARAAAGRRRVAGHRQRLARDPALRGGAHRRGPAGDAARLPAERL